MRRAFVALAGVVAAATLIAMWGGTLLAVIGAPPPGSAIVAILGLLFSVTLVVVLVDVVRNVLREQRP